MNARDGGPRGWRPVDPPQRPFLFINPASGGGTASRVMGEKAEALGIRCVVVEPSVRAARPASSAERRRKALALAARRRCPVFE